MHLCMPRRAIFICIYLSVSILCLCVFHFLLQLADFTSGFIKLNWHHRDILQCIECIPPTKRGIHCQQIFAINVAISLVTSDDSEEDDKRSGVLRSYPVKVPLYLCLFFNCLFLQTTNILKKRKSKRNLALLLFDFWWKGELSKTSISTVNRFWIWCDEWRIRIIIYFNAWKFRENKMPWKIVFVGNQKIVITILGLKGKYHLQFKYFPLNNALIYCL